MSDHVDRRRFERRWYARIAMANMTLTPLLAVLISWLSPESAEALSSAGALFVAAIPTSGAVVVWYLQVGHKENVQAAE